MTTSAFRLPLPILIHYDDSEEMLMLLVRILEWEEYSSGRTTFIFVIIWKSNNDVPNTIIISNA